MSMTNAVVATLAVAISSGASAATIVEWDFLGAPGNQASTAASATAANVSGTAITRGAGLGATAATNSFSSNSWNSASDPTEYISFGFTVDTGYSVDLESLYVGTRSSGTGPGTLGLYYSVDGFTANLFSFAQPDSTFVNSVVDLSSLPDVSGSVEFRLLEIGNTAANGGTTASAGTFRLTAYFESGVFDRNMQFTGTVMNPVPVPAAVWLLGSALAGLAGVARRRVA